MAQPRTLKSRHDELKATLADLEGLKSDLEAARVETEKANIRAAFAKYEASGGSGIATAHIEHVAADLGFEMDDQDLKACYAAIDVSESGKVSIEAYQKWWDTKELTKKSVLKRALLRGKLATESWSSRLLKEVGGVDTGKMKEDTFKMSLNVAAPANFEKTGNSSLHLKMLKNDPGEACSVPEGFERLPATFCVELVQKQGADAKASESALKSYLEKHLPKENIRFSVEHKGATTKASFWFYRKSSATSKRLTEEFALASKICKEHLSSFSILLDFGCNLAGAFSSKQPNMTKLVELCKLSLGASIEAKKAVCILLLRSFGADWKLASLGAVDDASIEFAFGELKELLELQNVKGFMETLPTWLKMVVMQAKQPAFVISNLLKAMGPSMLMMLPEEVREILQIFKKYFESIDRVAVVSDDGLSLVLEQKSLFMSKLVP